MLVCVRVNGEHWLGVHTFWSACLGAVETGHKQLGSRDGGGGEGSEVGDPHLLWATAEQVCRTLI